MTFASLCADEIYKQTILCKYAADTIYYDKYGNTTDLRYVDWSEGEDHPKILDESDYEKIIITEKNPADSYRNFKLISVRSCKVLFM